MRSAGSFAIANPNPDDASVTLAKSRVGSVEFASDPRFASAGSVDQPVAPGSAKCSPKEDAWLGSRGSAQSCLGP